MTDQELLDLRDVPSFGQGQDNIEERVVAVDLVARPLRTGRGASEVPVAKLRDGEYLLTVETGTEAKTIRRNSWFRVGR